MRFYSLSFNEVMELPIRAFWFLTEQVNRVRAEEILDQMPANTIMMGGDHVKGIVQDYQKRVGRPTIVDVLTMPKKDKERAAALFGVKK